MPFSAKDITIIEKKEGIRGLAVRILQSIQALDPLVYLDIDVTNGYRIRRNDCEPLSDYDISLICSVLDKSHLVFFARYCKVRIPIYGSTCKRCQTYAPDAEYSPVFVCYACRSQC